MTTKVTFVWAWWWLGGWMHRIWLLYRIEILRAHNWFLHAPQDLGLCISVSSGSLPLALPLLSVYLCHPTTYTAVYTTNNTSRCRAPADLTDHGGGYWNNFQLSFIWLFMIIKTQVTGMIAAKISSSWHFAYVIFHLLCIVCLSQCIITWTLDIFP